MPISVASKTTTFTNGTANDAVPVNSEFSALFNNDNTIVTQLNLVTDSNFTFTGNKTFNGVTSFSGAEVTITSGAITPATTLIRVDTEADAAADDLETINKYANNQLCVLRAENAAHVVTVKHNTGNIFLADQTDYVIDNTTDYLVLMFDSAAAKWVEIARSMRLLTSTELTIATGAITASRVRHTVDTESDAAADDLDTINGGVDGKLLILQPENTARVVTIKHNTGNILLANEADLMLANNYTTLTLIYDGGQSKWVEISRSNRTLEPQHLHRTTVSASTTTIDIDDEVDWAGFDAYLIRGRGLKLDTDGALFYGRLYNGSSYISAAGSYEYWCDTTGGSDFSDSANVIKLTDAGIGAAAGEQLDFEMMIYRMNEAGENTHIRSDLSYYTTTGRYIPREAAGASLTAAQHSGFQFLTNSTYEYTAGVIDVWGINF